MRIIIVDDEKRIRNTLINVLKLHCPNAIVVAEAGDITSAIEAINIQKPDVVLLDIKMPGGTGFDLLKKLMPLTFKVIFITAFDKYAIEAFKFSAIDYLLKPVMPIELVEALKRTEQQLSNENSNAKLDIFISNMSNQTKESKRIVLNSQNKMHVISINDIVRCEADGNYTVFVLADKRSVVVSKSLKEYDDMLSPFGFFRSHNSHLINLTFIDHLDKRDGGVLIMKDGSEALVSARKQSELVAAINNIWNQFEK